MAHLLDAGALLAAGRGDLGHDACDVAHRGDHFAHGLPGLVHQGGAGIHTLHRGLDQRLDLDRKSTRLNSSHSQISYAVFCLKKKNTNNLTTSEVADLLRGPKGSRVKITVLREGTEKPLEYNGVPAAIPTDGLIDPLMIPSGPSH